MQVLNTEFARILEVNLLLLLVSKIIRGSLSLARKIVGHADLVVAVGCEMAIDGMSGGGKGGGNRCHRAIHA